MGRQAGRRHQRFTGRDRRVRREPRIAFVFLNVPAMQQPEAYIGKAATLFDDNGALVDNSTREFMQKFLQAFAQWIERNAPR